MKTPFVAFILFLGLCGFMPASLSAEEYMSQQDFLLDAFQGQPYLSERLWLDATHKTEIKEMLGHAYGGLRVRYWKNERRTAWILEEIGKEQPITIGVAVESGKVHRLRVLSFRESRGWEVRHTFFTDQFNSVGLSQSKELDKNIDGITGATLSVRAIKKVARLALYFHSLVIKSESHEPPPQT